MIKTVAELIQAFCWAQGFGFMIALFFHILGASGYQVAQSMNDAT